MMTRIRFVYIIFCDRCSNIIAMGNLCSGGDIDDDIKIRDDIKKYFTDIAISADRQMQVHMNIKNSTAVDMHMIDNKIMIHMVVDSNKRRAILENSNQKIQAEIIAISKEMDANIVAMREKIESLITAAINDRTGTSIISF